MATITLPNTRVYTPATADWGLETATLTAQSPTDLSVQTVDMLASRWVCSLAFTPHQNAERAAVESLMAQMRGQGNRLSMGHPLRRVPRGTMRGTPTLTSTASALASTIAITGTGTLLAGDMLGIGGELVMVTADNPSLSAVPIAPFLRASKAAGTAVVWDWPRTLFIPRESGATRVPLGPRVSPGFSLDLVEVFA
ncbi:MAG: hypothetical protein RJA99_4240 [Pseudomonadota bacterium]|jgi:hypothetical protein